MTKEPEAAVSAVEPQRARRSAARERVNARKWAVSGGHSDTPLEEVQRKLKDALSRVTWSGTAPRYRRPKSRTVYYTSAPQHPTNEWSYQIPPSDGRVRNIIEALVRNLHSHRLRRPSRAPERHEVPRIVAETVRWGVLLGLTAGPSVAEATLEELRRGVDAALVYIDDALLNPDSEIERYYCLAHVRRVIREELLPICARHLQDRKPLLVILINAIDRARAKHVTNEDLQELRRVLARVAGDELDDRYLDNTEQELLAFGRGTR